MVVAVPSRVLIVLAAFLLLASAPAYAQAPAPADPTATPRAPMRLGPVTLSASMQADATRVNHDALSHNADPFRLRRARVGLGGNLTSRVAWNVSAELTTKEMLRNAYIQVRLHPHATLRAGQANPFSSIERGTGTTALEFVDRTRLTSRLTYAYDIGVALFSERPIAGWMNYAVGVVNGAGGNRRDDNHAKDVVARVEVTPPRLPHTSLVLSAAGGEQPEGLRTRASAGVQVDASRLKLTVEALREHDEWIAVRDGFLVSGVYRIHPAHVSPHLRMIELAGRFFTFSDPVSARGLPDDIGENATAVAADFVPVTTREIQGGANYYMNRNVRVLLNVVVPVDDRQAPGTTLVSRFQVAF